jgi:hypothetical protein
VTATAQPWHRRPLPSLAVGLALLAVTAGCAYLWLSESAEGARLLGSLAGIGGVLFTYGGIAGWRQSRLERSEVP